MCETAGTYYLMSVLTLMTGGCVRGCSDCAEEKEAVWHLEQESEKRSH